METQKYYAIEKIASNITKITDAFGAAAYLIEGEKKAALLDTCSGLGDFQSLISGLTTLPLIVICTHGHTDHAGGAFGFEHIYLNPKDFQLVKRHTAISFRKAAIDELLPPGTVDADDFLPQRDGNYEPLYDGQIFDIGGIFLEILELPGHTHGMSCVLIQELRTLLIGDACNSGTFLFADESSSVEEFRDNLVKFSKHSGKYDTVWFSHGHNTGTKQIITEGIDVCSEILMGVSDKVPFSFMGESAVIAKQMDSNMTRVDGKTFNVIYNPEKVFKK